MSTHDEMVRIGKEAGDMFRKRMAAVTDQDRDLLRTRMGIDPEAFDVFRSKIPEWEPFTVDACTFVYVGDGQFLSICPKRAPPPI